MELGASRCLGLCEVAGRAWHIGPEIDGQLSQPTRGLLLVAQAKLSADLFPPSMALRPGIPQPVLPESAEQTAIAHRLRLARAMDSDSDIIGDSDSNASDDGRQPESTEQEEKEKYHAGLGAPAGEAPDEVMQDHMYADAWGQILVASACILSNRDSLLVRYARASYLWASVGPNARLARAGREAGCRQTLRSSACSRQVNDPGRRSTCTAAELNVCQVGMCSMVSHRREPSRLLTESNAGKFRVQMCGRLYGSDYCACPHAQLW